MQGCCKLPFCRLRRWEGRMKRGHLALRQRAVALCTPTSKRGIPNLATVLDHNETYWYSTTYTFHKVQKYYALASEAGTFPGRDAIMSFNTFIVIWLTLHVADKSAVAAINRALRGCRVRSHCPAYFVSLLPRGPTPPPNAYAKP